jgi:hypothetical protein
VTVYDLTPLDADLDALIAPAVLYLREHGVDTFASCQGGEDHGHVMPCIIFHGDEHAGLWAVWLLERAGFRVWSLHRVWDLDHGLPRQPFWEVRMRSFGDGEP